MKIILITGASTGIGYATAKGLQYAGWHVFASCRNPIDVQRLQDEGLSALLLDVDDEESITAAFAQIQQQTNGRLDAIFCNAGYGQVGAVEDIPRQALRAQFETNVFGSWSCINHAMKIFRQQGHGRILVNSSILGYAAMHYRGAYNSSKFALEGLCDTLRHEIYGSNIFVSLIEPGPIVSQFRANALRKLQQYIDIEHSPHAKNYALQIDRMKKEGHAAPFTLPASACLKACQQALQAKRPKARYQVTFPAKLFWVLRRILPTVIFDLALRKIT